MHVMLDLETFGDSPQAVIVQIAAVAFELRSGGKVYDTKAFNVYVDPQSCANAGLTYDGDTMLWWLEQNDAARKTLVRNVREQGLELHMALDALNKWPEQVLDTNWASIEGVWANGAPFDAPIIETAYRRYNERSPWSFRKVYDQRTAYLLLGGKPDIPDMGTGHDAKDDCIYQICGLQTALAQAGG